MAAEQTQTQTQSDAPQPPALNHQQLNHKQQQEAATVVMLAASDHGVEGDKETRQKTANKSAGGKKRICCGRMSVCGKVCCFIGVVMVVVLAVMVPVTYCILVPRAVQGQLDRIIASSDQLVPSLDTSASKTLTNIPLTFQLTMGKQLLIPGTATLLGTTNLFQSLQSDGTTPWSRMDVPSDVSIPLNDRVNVTFSSTFVILDLGTATSLLLNPSTPVYLSSGWRVKMWGAVWYNDLQIKSQVSLQSGLGASLLKVVSASITSGINPFSGIRS